MSIWRTSSVRWFEQYALHMPAAEADWLIGQGIFTDNLYGIAFYSDSRAGRILLEKSRADLVHDKRFSHEADFARFAGLTVDHAHRLLPCATPWSGSWCPTRRSPDQQTLIYSA
jgi:hypothetical protein